MSPRRGLTALIAVSALTAAPATAAPRYNGFTGTVCLRSVGNATPLYDEFGVANQSTGETLHLACPLTLTVGNKRNLTVGAKLAASGSNCGTSGPQPTAAVIDQHTTQNAGCTIYVLGQGNAVMASFTAMSSGSDSSRQVLTFAMPPMDFSSRTLFAVCVLPPAQTTGTRSSLISFGVHSCDF